MEVREQVSTFSLKTKSPFHAIGAAKLWNSFAVGGSGVRERSGCEAKPRARRRGRGDVAGDGSARQDPVALPVVFPSCVFRTGGRIGDGEGQDQILSVPSLILSNASNPAHVPLPTTLPSWHRGDGKASPA